VGGRHAGVAPVGVRVAAAVVLALGGAGGVVEVLAVAAPDADAVALVVLHDVVRDRLVARFEDAPRPHGQDHDPVSQGSAVDGRAEAVPPDDVVGDHVVVVGHRSIAAHTVDGPGIGVDAGRPDLHAVDAGPADHVVVDHVVDGAGTRDGNPVVLLPGGLAAVV